MTKSSTFVHKILSVKHDHFKDDSLKHLIYILMIKNNRTHDVLLGIKGILLYEQFLFKTMRVDQLQFYMYLMEPTSTCIKFKIVQHFLPWRFWTLLSQHKWDRNIHILCVILIICHIT